jgi:hypothetical protein
VQCDREIKSALRLSHQFLLRTAWETTSLNAIAGLALLKPSGGKLEGLLARHGRAAVPSKNDSKRFLASIFGASRRQRRISRGLSRGQRLKCLSPINERRRLRRSSPKRMLLKTAQKTDETLGACPRNALDETRRISRAGSDQREPASFRRL